MTFGKLLSEYMDRFSDSPPIFGLPEDMAIKLMKAAIERGKPETHTPDYRPVS